MRGALLSIALLKGRYGDRRSWLQLRMHNGGEGGWSFCKCKASVLTHVERLVNTWGKLHFFLVAAMGLLAFYVYDVSSRRLSGDDRPVRNFMSFTA